MKYKIDLLNRRTLEKIEIERRYWAARKKSLKIITEAVISAAAAKNVEWFHSYREPQDFTDLDSLKLSLIGSILLNALRKYNAPLLDITLYLDGHLGEPAGTSLSIVRYLIANRHLRVNMLKPINPRKPLNLIS